MAETFTLVLDEDASAKLSGYDLYRSEETNRERPVIDGLYIQRGYLKGTPKALDVTVEIRLKR